MEGLKVFRDFLLKIEKPIKEYNEQLKKIRDNSEPEITNIIDIDIVNYTQELPIVTFITIDSIAYDFNFKTGKITINEVSSELDFGDEDFNFDEDFE